MFYPLIAVYDFGVYKEQRVSVAPICIYLYNLRFFELIFLAKVSFWLVWLHVSIKQSCCGDRFCS